VKCDLTSKSIFIAKGSIKFSMPGFLIELELILIKTNIIISL